MPKHIYTYTHLQPRAPTDPSMLTSSRYLDMILLLKSPFVRALAFCRFTVLRLCASSSAHCCIDWGRAKDAFETRIMGVCVLIYKQIYIYIIWRLVFAENIRIVQQPGHKASIHMNVCVRA